MKFASLFDVSQSHIRRANVQYENIHDIAWHTTRPQLHTFTLAHWNMYIFLKSNIETSHGEPFFHQHTCQFS